MQENQDIIRVAHIVGKWVGGGVEAVVMNYYRHINRNKIQFDFICDEDSTNIPYDEIEKLGGKVILIPPYQKVISYHKKLKQILKEGQYKIVHSHINTLSVFSLFAAKCAGVPVRIAHSHSTTNKKEKKKNLIKQVLRPFSKIFATDYMCCSELAGRWLFGNKEYDKGNVYLLNNAIDLDKFKYDEVVRREKRKELNIDDDTLVIGHVGRFVEQKNHRFLIDIFNEVHKQNENSNLLLVGQGPLMEEIKEKVKSLGIEDCVKFLGQRNDISELYQVFDVFCLPSLYEGLPVVGVEAQATGLLCLFSDDMTKETKVLESARFLSLQQNKNEWAEILLKSIENFKRKDTTVEFFKNGFDIKREVEKIEKYYWNKLIPTIIHVVNSKIFSGLESVACDIITSNIKEKYRLIYVTQKGPIVETLTEKNIDYEIIKKLNIKEMKRVIKKYHPMIIHAHDFTASVVCSAVKRDIPLIEHLHNNSPWLKKINIKSLVFLYAGLRADKILTVSESIENEYIFSKFIKNKIKCIDNPISRNKILSNVKGYKYKNEKIYDICCVARITAQKNPYRFLEILFEIKKEKDNVKAVWVGDGELKFEVLKKVDELKLNNNINFVGFQKNPYSYMIQSKIFMLTSDWEGYGLVAFEALTLGLPCVVSNVGGLPKIVDNECGKICRDNEDFIKECLSLLNNNALMEKKTNNAIEKSMHMDNFDNYIFELKSIYRKIEENKECIIF